MWLEIISYHTAYFGLHSLIMIREEIGIGPWGLAVFSGDPSNSHEPSLLPVLINYRLKMAASTAATFLYDTGSQVDFFKSNEVVLLHCVTRERFAVPMSCCDALGVWIRLCHISIPPDFTIRRGVMIPDRELKVATYDQTPRLLSVDSSCVLLVSFYTTFLQHATNINRQKFPHTDFCQ